MSVSFSGGFGLTRSCETMNGVPQLLFTGGGCFIECLSHLSPGMIKIEVHVCPQLAP